MSRFSPSALLLLLAALAAPLPPGLASPAADPAALREPSQPSAATRALHRQARKAIPPGEAQALMREAGRGFMLQLPFFGVIKDKAGQTVQDPSPYDFLKSAEAPASVHPRLWLQARLLMEGGLFKVAERIYQVRGADFANMTLIEGRTGLIVVDPLSSVETAQLALGLYYACRPGLPVVAVVYTGASPDRYGGAQGVCLPEDVKAGRVRVIAPAGFMRRVLAEAPLEGFARSRRLGFARGDFLPPGPRGQVGADAGMRSAEGLSALLPPTEFVGPGRTRLAVDGLTLDCHADGESALPGSMHCYIPELKALVAPQAAMPGMAGDEASGLDGQAGAFGEPDLLGWSRSLEDALRHAEDAEVMFGARCWPVFGRDAVRQRLMQARDAWRYVHDQTLHLAGQGLGPEAIAQQLRLPEDLAPSLRLAGSPLADIVEAFWRRQFGALEANPLRMRFFGPSEEGARYVAFMGGPGEVVAKARACMDAGEYRWAVQVLGHVVAAYPGIVPARLLCAEALEQLAYQEEGARRRNLYLGAARELRGGVLATGRGFLAMASRMGPEDMGAYLALLVNGEKAKGRRLAVSLKAPGWKRPLLLTLEHGVLHYDPDPGAKAGSDASLAGTQAVLCAVAEGALELDEAEAQKKLVLAGDRAKAEELLSCLEPFEASYPLTGLPPLRTAEDAGARSAGERALAQQAGGSSAKPDAPAEQPSPSSAQPSPSPNPEQGQPSQVQPAPSPNPEQGQPSQDQPAPSPNPEQGQPSQEQPAPSPDAEQSQPSQDQPAPSPDAEQGQPRQDQPAPSPDAEQGQQRQGQADAPSGAESKSAGAGTAEGRDEGKGAGAKPAVSPAESSAEASPQSSAAPEAGAGAGREGHPGASQPDSSQPSAATPPEGSRLGELPDASLPRELSDSQLWEPVPASSGSVRAAGQ